MAKQTVKVRPHRGRKGKRAWYGDLWKKQNPWYEELMRTKCEILSGWMDEHKISEYQLEKRCVHVKVGGRMMEGRYPTAPTIRRLYRVGRGEEQPYFVNDFVFTKLWAAIGIDPMLVQKDVQVILKEQRTWKLPVRGAKGTRRRG